MLSVLFSRPNHDGTLAYLYYYSKELVELSKNLGYSTINKEGKKATAKNILKVIEKKRPNFIMFNGHGGKDFVCGHNNEIIIQSKRNSEKLSKSIVYSFSCSSASVLGVESIKKGAISFIGYLFDFAVGKDPLRETAPSKDKIARLFLEPSNLLVRSILKKNKIKDAIIKAKNKIRENINYLNHTDDFSDAHHYAPFLYGNYLGLVAQGNSNFSL